MNKERADNLIDEYKKLISTYSGITPKRNREAFSFAGMMGHLLWMLNHMPDPINKEDKFYRWLGFIQGGFWAIGVKDISNMCVDNYVLIHGELPPKD